MLVFLRTLEIWCSLAITGLMFCFCVHRRSQDMLYTVAAHLHLVPPCQEDDMEATDALYTKEFLLEMMVSCFVEALSLVLELLCADRRWGLCCLFFLAL